VVGGGGGGAPISYDRRRRRQQNVGGGGAAAAAHSSRPNHTKFKYLLRIMEKSLKYCDFIIIKRYKERIFATSKNSVL